MTSPIRLDPIATHGSARAGALAAVDLATRRRWTWRELDAAVNRTAHWLQARLGPRSSARIATLSRNCVDMVVLQRACARAGAIFVPLNWRLAAAEITELCRDAQPALLFCGNGFDGTGLAPDLLPLAELATAVSPFPTTPIPSDAGLNADEPWTLLYTSGTSGKPKGVIVSQANAFWGATNFLHGNGVSSASVFLCDMPLFHTAGLFAATGTPLLAGATLLISEGFDPARTLATIAHPAWGVTHYFSVPQMAQMLWNQPGFEPAMLAGLQVYATGGAPNPKAQIVRFVNAGIAMSDGFGMSETCSNFAMPAAEPDVLVAKAGSIGLPLLTVEARIVDDRGEDVADGEVGELWVRGPSVTAGYWNRPDLTAEAFAGDWFRTGDAARRDEDGFFFLVDRRKDMYISGGENVYPAEVEAAIAELPEIAECAVIGVPDARWGEVGRAFVILVDGAAFGEEAVLAHCRARLAAFKVPKTVVIGEAIPRTASGKVQKHLLRAAVNIAAGPDAN
jgi:fatty-acyl-CoA synthase